MNQKIYIWIIGGTLIFLLFVIAIWFFFFRTAATVSTNTIDTGGTFGTSVNSSIGVNSNNTDTQNINGTQPIAESGQVSSQKIFQIAGGPIAGATLIQTLHPTTTLARYVNQNDGHVYDLPLDIAGSVPRVVSNVTIPGANRTIWLEGGNAVVLQYIDGSIVKSVYLGLPAATTSTKTVNTRIQFLPDNIMDLASSPDGASIAYLLKTSSGSDGYTARSDGTGAKKVFSLQLSQVLISWPSQGTLLVESKPAIGVNGIVFSVDIKSGVVTPLLYAQDVTAIADKTFSNIVYQAVPQAETIPTTYIHSVKTGLDLNIDFNPVPEKCIWSNTTATHMYCAISSTDDEANYLDLWHQGLTAGIDAIFSFDISSGANTLIGIPGGKSATTAVDIFEMALSPDEHYLSFTTKGARTLWGVRLTQ